ncbi:MAG: hypothetical protein ACLTCQ_17090 [Enterocloster bolteae]
MPNQWGIIDSTAIVRAFHEKGYEGPVIVEPMAPTTERYETMKLEEAVREAALCLNGVLQEAGVFI